MKKLFAFCLMAFFALNMSVKAQCTNFNGNIDLVFSISKYAVPKLGSHFVLYISGDDTSLKTLIGFGNAVEVREGQYSFSVPIPVELRNTGKVIYTIKFPKVKSYYLNCDYYLTPIASRYDVWNSAGYYDYYVEVGASADDWIGKYSGNDVITVTSQ